MEEDSTFAVLSDIIAWTDQQRRIVCTGIWISYYCAFHLVWCWKQINVYLAKLNGKQCWNKSSSCPTLPTDLRRIMTHQVQTVEQVTIFQHCSSHFTPLFSVQHPQSRAEEQTAAIKMPQTWKMCHSRILWFGLHTGTISPVRTHKPEMPPCNTLPLLFNNQKETFRHREHISI